MKVEIVKSHREIHIATKNDKIVEWKETEPDKVYIWSFPDGIAINLKELQDALKRLNEERAKLI